MGGNIKRVITIFLLVLCASGAYAESSQDDSNKSPDNWKNKTEWFGVNAGFGNYGFTLFTTAATLRWDHFYWTILSANLTMSNRTGTFFFHGGFSRFGIPIHVGSSDRHEIRVGLSLEVALGVQMEVTQECSGEDTAPDCIEIGEIYDLYVAPELSYHFHILRRFSLRAGAVVHIAMVDLFKVYNGERMPPNVVGYIGFSL